MKHKTNNQQLILLSIAQFFIFILIMIDIYDDYKKDSSIQHISIELLLSGLAMVTLLFLAKEWYRKNKQLKQAFQQINEQSETLHRQSQKLQQAKKDFQQNIKDQFKEWQLSQTEQATALLLIKGLSHAEIANIRSLQEKTIRQQASQIYQKADLPGRYALAAWFLEDFL